MGELALSAGMMGSSSRMAVCSLANSASLAKGRLMWTLCRLLQHRFREGVEQRMRRRGQQHQVALGQQLVDGLYLAGELFAVGPDAGRGPRGLQFQYVRHQLIAPVHVAAFHIAGDAARDVLEQKVHGGAGPQGGAVHHHVFQFNAGDLEEAEGFGVAHALAGVPAGWCMPIFFSMVFFSEPMMRR
jgi:hypothetical protein